MSARWVPSWGLRARTVCVSSCFWWWLAGSGDFQMRSCSEVLGVSFGGGTPFNLVHPSSLSSHYVLTVGLLVCFGALDGWEFSGQKRKIPCRGKSVSKGPQKRGNLSGVLMHERHFCSCCLTVLEDLVQMSPLL